jgi:integrase
MGSIYPRRKRLWMQFHDHAGERVQMATQFRLGQEALARQALADVESSIEAGTKFNPAKGGPVTVADYADPWLDKRDALGIADAVNDRARLRDHVLPHLGDMPLERVQPRHLVALFTNLRKSGVVAPKTIHNIYSPVRALFRDAKLEGLYPGDSPCILTKFQLGENVDKDPEWRANAVFSRTERVSLITDERIPLDRRTYYAIEAIGGLRLGEVVALRVRHVEFDKEPLGHLVVAKSHKRDRTKAGFLREVPIHPALADILARWLVSGWEAMMGRAPTPDDLLLPLPPEHSIRRRNNPEAEPMRSKTYCFKRLRDDLVVLGLRHRRGHDLRHTMITLAREDEMDLDILKTITHDPGKKKASSAIHAYIRYSWPVRCREILKMQVMLAPTEKSSEPDGTGSKSPSDPAPQAREILDASYTPSYTLSDFPAVKATCIVEAPGTAPGSGGAPFMSLRACPAIWFSSPGWPAGRASRKPALPVSRGRAGRRCAAAKPTKCPLP